MPPSFIMLNIILAYDGLNFFNAVVTLVILRSLALSEVRNIFEGMLLRRYGIYSLKKGMEIAFLERINQNFLFTVLMSRSKKNVLIYDLFHVSPLTLKLNFMVCFFKLINIINCINFSTLNYVFPFSLLYTFVLIIK